MYVRHAHACVKLTAQAELCVGTIASIYIGHVAPLCVYHTNVASVTPGLPWGACRAAGGALEQLRIWRPQLLRADEEVGGLNAHFRQQQRSSGDTTAELFHNAVDHMRPCCARR